MTLQQKIAQLHGAMETIDIYSVQTGSAEEVARSSPTSSGSSGTSRASRSSASRGSASPTARWASAWATAHPSPKATALPMTIGLAAGFDPALAREYGTVIGSETATLGQHVLEGPGLCLHRTPVSGRNFEYFSEDPYLSGVMGVEVARAIQEHGVIAMAKHYVCNDQEYERFRANVEVDERTLRELYLLPFEMVVKDAGIAAIMSAYNRVRGTYATENRYLLHTVLREEWGFHGYVQSDFWSARSAAPGSTPASTTRCPTASGSTRRTSRPPCTTPAWRSRPSTAPWCAGTRRCSGSASSSGPYDPGEIDAQAHGAISRRIGAQIAVLLKNDGGVLPLDPGVATIAVIGQVDVRGRGQRSAGAAAPRSTRSTRCDRWTASATS